MISSLYVFIGANLFTLFNQVKRCKNASSKKKLI
jgi:hypothetical protein